MKLLKSISLLSILILGLLFASCEKSNDDNDSASVLSNGAFVLNYGKYGSSNGEVSYYNIKTKEVVNGLYNNKTSVDYAAGIESGLIYNDVLYLMGNESDKIDIIELSPDFTVKSNPIKVDIVKPKHAIAKNNKLYVSCWGNVVKWDVIANSYIAVVDLKTKVVTKIAAPGGYFDLEIVGDKLYAASYTKPQVDVYDILTNELIGSIALKSHARMFKVTTDNNLWVSNTASYSFPASPVDLGLSKINTTTNTIEAFVNVSSLASDGQFELSKDGVLAYALAGGDYYQDTEGNWLQNEANVSSINLTTSEISVKISGGKYQNIHCNPNTGEFYVLNSPESSTAGSLVVFNEKFEKVNEVSVGIAPKQVLFY